MLDRGYPAVPWDRLDPSVLPPGDIEIARRAWAARTVAEYRSMMVFGEIIARLPELRLPLEVMSAASRLLQDEARHTELCARVADALGGHEGVSLDASDLRLSRDGLSAQLFVARWTASMFCVGEASSVGLLRALIEHTTDPAIGVVLRILHRDEQLHDRFGWALARIVLVGLTEEQRDWLGADLAFAFAHYDRLHAAGEAPAGASEALAEAQGPNLGVAPRSATARAFHGRIDDVILPQLARLGVPAYEAWMLRGEVPSR